MRKTEHQEQCALFAWIRQAAAVIPEFRLIFAVPNGGKRTAGQKIWMWQEGLESGVPDIFCAVPKNGKHGLFIEMKIRPHGRLSKEQKRWLTQLESAGYQADVAWTAEEAKHIILEYLGMKGL